MTTPIERAVEIVAQAQNVPFAGAKQRRIVEALVAAGLIATEQEWGVAFPCRPGCPAGDEHINAEDFGAGEEMARGLVADDPDRLTLKTRTVTPWKDAP